MLLGGDACHRTVGEAQEQAMRRLKGCRAEPITLPSSDPQVGTPPITIGAFERQGACPQLVFESCARCAALPKLVKVHSDIRPG